MVDIFSAQILDETDCISRSTNTLGKGMNPIIQHLAIGGARGVIRRNWTRRHEFKSWTRLIAFHIALIHLGKV